MLSRPCTARVCLLAAMSEFCATLTFPISDSRKNEVEITLFAMIALREGKNWRVGK